MLEMFKAKPAERAPKRDTGPADGSADGPAGTGGAGGGAA
jgi:hypothetical protein